MGARGGRAVPLNRIADIAQMAERILGKEEVMGIVGRMAYSIPVMVSTARRTI